MFPDPVHLSIIHLHSHKLISILTICTTKQYYRYQMLLGLKHSVRFLTLFLNISNNPYGSFFCDIIPNRTRSCTNQCALILDREVIYFLLPCLHLSLSLIVIVSVSIYQYGQHFWLKFQQTDHRAVYLKTIIDNLSSILQQVSKFDWVFNQLLASYTVSLILLGLCMHFASL